MERLRTVPMRGWLSSLTLLETESAVSKYSDIAHQIINLAVYGKAQNRSDERLAEFTDTIGNRVSGSKNLDLNVHLELVKIPHWVRGEESAVMLLPRNHTLAILGLGSSVGTPPGGIEAEAMVVESFEELKKRASEAKGKIVVYNQPFVSYGETVTYRASGASEAAKVGAVASLHPHTGWQWYQPGVAQIPTACITVEDAQMMARMACRGQRIVVRLTMRDQTLPDVDSYNTLAEITGSEHPEQVVLLSGHLDSWDMGQGAMDDGGGVTISWEALSLIRDLGLRPKRTLRTVLWSAEEPGGVGAAQYFQQHKANISNFNLVMESDLGTFSPLGLQFTGSDEARAIMKEVMKLLATINVTSLEEHGEGTDVNSVHYVFFPGASLHTADQRYFWFHHSDSDTMSVQNPEEMNLCSTVWAVVAYVVTDLDGMLTR
uniref:Carboxypeptidase Q n=1 Tax=Sinocyclocheilus rhinocerous TaxID=307959 RepID=A0A673HZZ5_9TELE